MTTAHSMETSVTGTNNNPSQDYTHTYNQTTMLHERHVVFDCVCFYCILKRMFSIRFIIPLSRLFLCSKNLSFKMRLGAEPRSLYIKGFTLYYPKLESQGFKHLGNDLLLKCTQKMFDIT